MRQLLKNEWSIDSEFKKWNQYSCVDKKNVCDCGDGDHLVELWDHDSCVIGRIDTTICVICDSIKEFKIVR